LTFRRNSLPFTPELSNTSVRHCNAENSTQPQSKRFCQPRNFSQYEHRSEGVVYDAVRSDTQTHFIFDGQVEQD
jgi:hypothetical protein